MAFYIKENSMQYKNLIPLTISILFTSVTFAGGHFISLDLSKLPNDCKITQNNLVQPYQRIGDVQNTATGFRYDIYPQDSLGYFQATWVSTITCGDKTFYWTTKTEGHVESSNYSTECIDVESTTGFLSDEKGNKIPGAQTFPFDPKACTFINHENVTPTCHQSAQQNCTSSVTLPALF